METMVSTPATIFMYNTVSELSTNFDLERVVFQCLRTIQLRRANCGLTALLLGTWFLSGKIFRRALKEFFRAYRLIISQSSLSDSKVNNMKKDDLRLTSCTMTKNLSS